MFSSLTQRLGTRVLDLLDLLVEVATLGGYGVDQDGVFALEPAAFEDGLRALALSGAGAVAMARTGAPAGSPAPAGRDSGERARGDCTPAGALSRLSRGGAARP